MLVSELRYPRRVIVGVAEVALDGREDRIVRERHQSTFIDSTSAGYVIWAPAMVSRRNFVRANGRYLIEQPAVHETLAPRRVPWRLVMYRANCSLRSHGSIGSSIGSTT